MFIQTTAHPLLPSPYSAHLFIPSFSLLSMSPTSLFQWKLPEALAKAVRTVCLLAGPCLLFESCEKAITLNASEMNHNHNHPSPAPVPSFISHEWTAAKWMLTFVYTALTMSSLYCVVKQTSPLCEHQSELVYPSVLLCLSRSSSQLNRVLWCTDS